MSDPRSEYAPLGKGYIVGGPDDPNRGMPPAGIIPPEQRSPNERAMDIAFDALLNIRDGQIRSTSVRGFARRTVEAIDAALADHSGSEVQP